VGLTRVVAYVWVYTARHLLTRDSVLHIGVDAIAAQRKSTHPAHVFITIIVVITIVGAVIVVIGFVERAYGACFFDNATPLHYLLRVEVC
jgi:hypothetical protein